MKKTLLIILVIMLMPTNMKASSFSTSISSNKTISSLEQFNLTLNISSTTGLMGIQAQLNYDSSKLTLISTAGSNGFTTTVGSKVVADNTIAKSGSFSFAVLTFKATSAFLAGESTNVSINNVMGSDGTNDLTGSGSSATITVATPKSTNNNLSNLTINGSTISGFTTTKTSYSLTLENNVTSINIGAIASDSKSTITGTGTKSLSDYLNIFNVVVKAESGSLKTYTINIYRKDKDGRLETIQTDNTLSSLVVEGYDINFNPNLEIYNLDIENIVTSLTISVTATSPKASYLVNNINELKVGLNVITIVVTAENGIDKTYTINVTRKNDGVTTTLDKLIDIIDKVTASSINVTISDQYELTKVLLEKIKTSNKIIVINKYDSNSKLIYTWNIDSSKINNIESINTEVLFTSENIKNISILSNYANGLYLNFKNEGVLPDNTTITVYVGNEYADGEILNLYYYNNITNNLEKTKDGIIVKDNYVTFELEHTSEYLLTGSEISSNTNLWITIYVEGLIIALFTAYIIFRLINDMKKY